MKIVATLALALVSACAGTTTASRDSTGAAPARLGSQSCAAPLVASVAQKGSEVYSGPDGTSTLLATFKSDTPVCAESTSRGFGYRRIQLSDGRTGFVAEQSISNHRG
jgi:hypothetical protein